MDGDLVGRGQDKTLPESFVYKIGLIVVNENMFLRTLKTNPYSYIKKT